MGLELAAVANGGAANGAANGHAKGAANGKPVDDSAGEGSPEESPTARKALPGSPGSSPGAAGAAGASVRSKLPFEPLAVTFKDICYGALGVVSEAPHGGWAAGGGGDGGRWGRSAPGRNAAVRAQCLPPPPPPYAAGLGSTPTSR